MQAKSTGEQVTIASKNGFWNELKDIYLHKFLIFSFFRRDVKVRYAQTYLGTLWAFMQPIMLAVPVLVIFKRLNLQSNHDYTALIMCALPLWLYFNNTVNQVSSSLQQNQNLIRKVWFPRMALPLSKALLNTIDLAAGLLLMVIVLLWVKVPYTPSMWLIPLVLLQLMWVSLGMGLLIAAFSIKYRDVLQTLSLLLQVLQFASPVLYTASFIKGWDIEPYYYINPMVAIIELMRSCVLNAYELNVLGIFTSLSVGWLIGIVGVFVFIKKSQRAGELL